MQLFRIRTIGKQDLALWSLILVCAVVLFYPYFVNHTFIVAAAHADDDFYVYNSVVNNMQYFNNDIFYYLVPCFVKGTILNWGALWLVNTLGIPIAVVSLSLQAVMLFMLPLLYVFMTRRYVEKVWLPYIFLAGLLCHHYTWNLTNHSMVDLPYRPHLAIPVMILGIMLLIRENRFGYLIVAFGIMFHVPMGLYAFLAIALWQVVHYRRILSRHTLLLLPLIIGVAIPTISVLSQDYPAVPKADILDLYRLNMHFYPWDSPFLWDRSLSVVTAFVLLVMASYPHRNALGKEYGQLVTACIASTIIMCLSHLAGVVIQMPALINVCGLRSVAFLAVVMLPVVLLYLINLTGNGSLTEKSLAAFILLCLVVGRPYGLYVFPGLALLLYRLPGRLCGGMTGKILALSISAMVAGWFSAWLLFSAPPGHMLANALVPHAGYVLWKFVLPVVADSAPAMSRLPWTVAGAGLLMFVIALALRCFIKIPYRVYPVVLAVAAVLFLGSSTRGTLLRTGSQPARDLYDAQVWARENTSKADMFIVFDGSWRAFSERPAFVPDYLGYYMYLPDKRIKAFDDFVFGFYGIDEPFRYYDLKSLSSLIRSRYMMMSENDFYILAGAVNAQYLVETRLLNLPLAYRNATYYIYRLM